MIAIADYDTGNLRSVSEALRRAGAEFVVTSDIGTLRRADKVILPGVGEASASMARLRERGLDAVLPTLTCPVLGICVGLQLMCRSSDEGGGVDCMGIFPVRVVRLPEATPEGRWKVPHMGWNTIQNLKGPLYKGIEEGSFVYFVHSYYVPVNPCTAAVTEYIVPFSAALHKDNFYATQFHPEKSGSVGERILKNFLDLTV